MLNCINYNHGSSDILTEDQQYVPVLMTSSTLPTSLATSSDLIRNKKKFKFYMKKKIMVVTDSYMFNVGFKIIVFHA